jgi:hypothetical protein
MAQLRNISDQGVTLVEVVVATAILVTTVFALSYYHSNLQRLKGAKTAQIARINFTNEFQFAMASQCICTGNLGGRSVSISGAAVDINPVVSVDSSCAQLAGQSIFAEGTQDGLVSIDKIIVQNHPSASATPTSGVQVLDVIVQAHNNMEMFGGSAFAVSTTIPATTKNDAVSTNSGTDFGPITACGAAPPAQTSQQLSQAICSVAGAGSGGLVYNSITKQCISPYANCVAGSATQATCPATSISCASNSDCSTSTTSGICSGGFCLGKILLCTAYGNDNPPNSVTLQYSNGAQQQFSPPPSLYQTTGATCNCIYATDLGTNPPGWSCNVCCGT